MPTSTHTCLPEAHGVKACMTGGVEHLLWNYTHRAELCRLVVRCSTASCVRQTSGASPLSLETCPNHCADTVWVLERNKQQRHRQFSSHASVTCVCSFSTAKQVVRRRSPCNSSLACMHMTWQLHTSSLRLFRCSQDIRHRVSREYL